jgi:hypothetical protein
VIPNLSCCSREEHKCEECETYREGLLDDLSIIPGSSRSLRMKTAACSQYDPTNPMGRFMSYAGVYYMCRWSSLAHCIYQTRRWYNICTLRTACRHAFFQLTFKPHPEIWKHMYMGNVSSPTGLAWGSWHRYVRRSRELIHSTPVYLSIKSDIKPHSILPVWDG